ncbi:hypothetical protein [Psychrobacillus vulpis]|uniref:Uncharacterized protein n=1 Tax=Psychrobacillus vulpis TaxID=2325572 RepID=A0A544TS97_9BACI|nr:hypothetical protein [Psychrobacillus vulpis]TQR20317.1 hypothetical protein FG384_07695 [Psychrobacillus vulpis]
MKKLDVGFTAAGATMTIIFLLLVNYLTSPSYPWFLYPFFVLLLSVIGLYCAKKGKHKLLSVLYSAIIIVFLITENVLYTPQYPWFLYATFPILWWPILVFLGTRAKMMTTAWIGSMSIILYYLILNTFLSPGYPWVIYPAFVVLWWPLALYHAQKKTYFKFSIHASILIIVFFILVNFISSPQTIWAVYPIFCVLWWPLSMYYFVFKRRMEH